MKEKDIQRQILEWLTWKKIFHYRQNSGAFRTNNDTRMYWFGAKGAPDIVCVINGQYVGIEVKMPKNGLSELQVNFKYNLEMAGGKYIIAYCLEDVIKNI